MASQGWETDCSKCGRTVYPYLSEKPVDYICQLCRSGAGEGRRMAARKRWAKNPIRIYQKGSNETLP